MKLLYIPLLACLFLCSCRHHNDDYTEQTNLKIKVLKERGDSVEKANVERGNNR